MNNKIVNWWREEHLKPLTEVTLKVIEWFQSLNNQINLNQRLKRKPQIIKKIIRKPNMRLSQMQDIGGCRAIFDSNEQLETALELIKTKSKRYKYFSIVDVADYRTNGRQESGYRACHVIVERSGYKIEIQLRSRLQHAWAEAIERTSVLCEYPLKEGEGPEELREFFKVTSDCFNEVDRGRKVPVQLMKTIWEKEDNLMKVVSQSPKMETGGKKMNEDFMKAMVAREKKRKGKIKNWVLIFDWKQGVFTYWSETDQDPEVVAKEYADKETRFQYEDGYEVVLIGSTSVASIRETHSHYFGVESYSEIMAKIHSLMENGRNGLSGSAHLLLSKLVSHGHWGANTCSVDTIKNHYCSLDDIEDALRELNFRGLVAANGYKDTLSLVSGMRGEILKILG